MSVVIRINRNESESRFFYLRDFQFSFGFDPQGILTWQNVDSPIFTMSARENGYILRSETSNLLCNGQLHKETQELVVSDEAFLEYEDCKINLWITSGESELLARADNVPLDALLSEFSNVPLLRVGIGNALKIFPLLSHIPVSLGSDSKNMVQIEMSGIKPFHCSVEYDHPIVRIQEMQGKVCIDAEPVKGTEAITQDRLITLLPSGIQAEVCFGNVSRQTF